MRDVLNSGHVMVNILRIQYQLFVFLYPICSIHSLSWHMYLIKAYEPKHPTLLMLFGVSLRAMKQFYYTTVAILQKIFFRATIFLYSLCHYMRAWICVLDVPGCYEGTVRGERKSALQGSGLVRIVGPCAQSRVPRAIATARDALSKDRHESTARSERPAKHWGSSEARGDVCSFNIIPVSSPVATFRKSPLHTYT